jgi:Tetratricopeptide repeat
MKRSTLPERSGATGLIRAGDRAKRGCGWRGALELAARAASLPRGKGLLGLGAIEWRQGRLYACPRAYLREPRHSDQFEDFTGLGEALHLAVHVGFEAGEYVEAFELFERSQVAYTRVDDPLGGLALIGDLGLVAYHQARARHSFEHCLSASRESGVTDHGTDSLNRLGDLARIDGDLQRAENLYSESLVLWRSVHATPGTASALDKLGQIARRRGRDGNRAAPTEGVAGAAARSRQ